MILQSIEVSLLETTNPSTQHLPGCVLPARCRTDTGRLLTGALKVLSCFNPGHRVYLPVG
jgi:hypothetical protein